MAIHKIYKRQSPIMVAWVIWLRVHKSAESGMCPSMGKCLAESCWDEMGNLLEVCGGNWWSRDSTCHWGIWMVVWSDMDSTLGQGKMKWGLLKGKTTLSRWPFNIIWKKEQDQEKLMLFPLPRIYHFLPSLCPADLSASFSSQFKCPSWYQS